MFTVESHASHFLAFKTPWSGDFIDNCHFLKNTVARLNSVSEGNNKSLEKSTTTGTKMARERREAWISDLK